MGPSSRLKSNNNKKIICENFDCLVSTAELLRPKKLSTEEDLSTITLGYIKNKGSNQKTIVQKRLRILFDSGCSATLINKKAVRHWNKTKDRATRWSTKAGDFKTSQRCEIEFQLPAFHENRVISCNAYVDETNPELCKYDMIIGRDLMHSMGVNLLFDTAEISWDNATIKMISPDNLNKDWVEDLEQEFLFAHDPDTTDAKRIQDIIESKYCPADLNKIVAECKHLENLSKNSY